MILAKDTVRMRKSITLGLTGVAMFSALLLSGCSNAGPVTPLGTASSSPSAPSTETPSKTPAPGEETPTEPTEGATEAPGEASDSPSTPEVVTDAGTQEQVGSYLSDYTTSVSCTPGEACTATAGTLTKDCNAEVSPYASSVLVGYTIEYADTAKTQPTSINCSWAEVAMSPK